MWCTGAAGFQLINVNAVPLELNGWSTCTQLASRKALTASLYRHYRDECIKEAHKVRCSWAQHPALHLDPISCAAQVPSSHASSSQVIHA